MKVLRTVKEIEETTSALRAEGKTIGLVPTMGALHAGHVSLMERARTENEVVVASVFVNPTQFNNPEDLRTYPRTEDEDCRRMADAGVDYAFIPAVDEVYPEEDKRQFELGPVAEVMEGAMRPGHFNGVAQIVSKLFAWMHPTNAYFGEKDFQQIAVIRAMARAEGFDINIIDCPIVREKDGLALSSRNVRLTPGERAVAPLIHATLAKSVQFAHDHGVADTEAFVVEEINANPHMRVEYFNIVHPMTMQRISSWGDADEPVGCITVYCGDVRLIDNIKYTDLNP